MSESNSPTSIFNTEKCPADQLLWTIKERISRAHTIENILSPISSRDEYIFRTNPNVDDDDASQISELSDPFQELGGNIISNAENNQKRRLSKLEADVLVMNSFPSAHMQIQASLIESGGLENSFFSPDIHVEIVAGADASFDDSESDVEFFQQISTTMDQVGIKSYKEDKKKNEDREKQRQKLKSKKSLDDQDIDSSSLLSGIWRMLGTLIYKQFIETSPTFFCNFKF